MLEGDHHAFLTSLKQNSTILLPAIVPISRDELSAQINTSAQFDAHPTVEALHCHHSATHGRHFVLSGEVLKCLSQFVRNRPHPLRQI